MKKIKWLVIGWVFTGVSFGSVLDGTSNTTPAGTFPNLIVILADDMDTGDMGAFRELYQGGPEELPPAKQSEYKWWFLKRE